MTSARQARLFMLFAAPGSGKGKLAGRAAAAGFEVLSMHDARTRCGRYDGDRDATPRALAVLIERAVQVLHDGRDVVLDANVGKPIQRAQWRGVARGTRAIAEVIRLSTPLTMCRAVNAAKPPERRLPARVVDDVWYEFAAIDDEQLVEEGLAIVRWVPERLVFGQDVDADDMRAWFAGAVRPRSHR